MPISVLLTEGYHPLLYETLSQWQDVRVVHLATVRLEEVYQALREAQVWIQRGALRVDENLLTQAPKLRLIIRAGSGTDHIDLGALAKHGITLHTLPQANAMPVAEYVVAALLILSRNFLLAHHALREKETWMRHPYAGRELASLKVGIIGFGENGSRTAYLLRQLGAQVLAYDKYKFGFGGLGIREVSLSQLWEEAEVLSLHVPLTEETKNWVNRDFLRRFSRPILLINPARGGIVCLPSLAEALQEGRVIAAALDTLPAEPPEKLSPEDRAAWSYLRQHPAVFLTPHIAGLTQESEERLARGILALLRWWIESRLEPQEKPI
ncbi:MAG: phosphoglycerate dehydrogenase [Bacteroidia bacterium]|nr:phosphoglycerate dehydrogenase [Bacteroidia bacterium]MDW8236287.1 NAD(P)-dependent oxidoreductase [Bacteroidia bacterium]